MLAEPSHSDARFTEELKQFATELGFHLSGVCAAAEPGRLEQFRSWLEAGYAAGMSYFANRKEAYSHPAHVLDGCRSILMLAMPYSSSTETDPTQPGTGKVARYARGKVDYHDVIHARLKQLKRWVLGRQPNARVRGVVDTAPLLEREYAELAGLGWVGKNTLLLNRQHGSYFFLAALLTDLELDVDPPHEKGYCGTCTACLDACPTKAFPKPYVLDANRCLSYLTIEHRGDVDVMLVDQYEGWVFGCDICQEVCPWNRHEKPHEPSLEPHRSELDLVDILRLDEDSFRSRFRKTAFWRTRREGMVRNAVLLAVSQRRSDVLPELRRLANEPSPQIQHVVRWAIKELTSPA